MLEAGQELCRSSCGVPASSDDPREFSSEDVMSLAAAQWLLQEKAKGRLVNDLAYAVWRDLLADAARDIGAALECGGPADDREATATAIRGGGRGR